MTSREEIEYDAQLALDELRADVGPEMVAEIDARVQRGIALLDRAEPGWDAKIDLTKLNMQSTLFCVLGMTDADYASHRIELFDPTYRHNSDWLLDRAVEHGFDLHDAEGRAWNYLDYAWRIAIAARTR